MKCLKAIKEGKYSKVGDIIRVSEKDAISKVDSGYWMYVPKLEWKKMTRAIVETEEKSNKEEKKVNKNQRKDKFVKNSKKD